MSKMVNNDDDGKKLLESTVIRYRSNLSTYCNFPNYIFSVEIFKFPVLNDFHTSLNRITKWHLLEAFFSFLVRLLYHKTDQTVDPFQHVMGKLEKELRFVLTILGDISWMQFHHDDHEAELLVKFEALANEAGSFLHCFFFSGSERREDGLAAILNQIDLLNASLHSSVSLQRYATPTTSLVDSIIILNSVVEDLDDLLKRDDDPTVGVKDQVNHLHHQLLLSLSLIKRISSPSQIEQLKEALMQIGGIAHQVDYLVTSYLVKDAPLWYVFSRLTDLGNRIEPIRVELQLIAQNYLVGGLKVAQYSSAEVVSLQNKRVNDVIVGFEGKIIEILDQLVGVATNRLQVISILGMPGLGKTTLANILYNHPLVRYQYDKLVWCVISQTYTRKSILANILVQINSELGKGRILNMEEINLKEHIHKTLIGRRYLIVLDDVWDSIASDALIRCFPDDGSGSRILLTSRNKEVAPSNSIIHELSLLSDEQCWELLEKKVFGGESCPPLLQEIGKKIAARCCGLPLTAVVIAGVLSSAGEEVKTWEEVERSMGSYIDGEDNRVMQILELSYKHLPDHLKSCFLYFGQFEEDKEIRVGNLKRLWVAEGFIRKERDKRAEDIAGEYLMELIDKSLIMIAKKRKDGRGAKSCIVHDLLRELCIKISRKENFMIYLNRSSDINFQKGHRVRGFRGTKDFTYCQHVRSFVGDITWEPLYVRDMRLLRVLHFKSHCHYYGIEYLVNLRSLIITVLPMWIERLVNLEYLRVYVWAYCIHPTVFKMKKLRHLHLPEYEKDWEINNFRFQTCNLEYLSGITIQKLEDEEFLKSSPRLRVLKCNFEAMKSVYPPFGLGFLTQLDSLTLRGNLGSKDYEFPSNIRKLTLECSGLSWEKMSMLGSLRYLEVLKLRSNAFEGKRWDTRDGEFQELRFLQLDQSSLYEWGVVPNEHFPKLEYLVVGNCRNLKEIPVEIGEIAALELIKVYGSCSRSLVESVERIKEEQLEMGNENLRIIIRQDMYQDDKEL